MLAIVVGSAADFIWNLIRLACAVLAFALFTWGILVLGLFLFVTLSDAPPFEVIPKRW